MKRKTRRFMESVLAVVFLAGVWFIYDNYLLTNATNSAYLVLDNTKRGQVVWVTIITLVIVFLIAAYLLIDYIHRWLNRRSTSVVMSNLAYDLCRLYLDEDFISHCQRFGIIISHDSINISPEIMSKCSSHSLAKLLSAMFNKYADFNFDFDKIFNSLADLIIDTWSGENVDIFVHYIYLENIILGEDLRYVIDRLKVSREASEFNKSVESRLAELDKLRETKSLATTARINSQFQYSDYLTSGGSAFKSWLKTKLTWRRAAKLVTVK